MYGNPIDRTFVMESVSDVKAVIRNFNDCPITKRHILASNIKKAFNEFGMKQPVIVEENNIPYQFTELGKVDIGGGGTIAYILANKGMDVIDCGVPVLSMHAPYEVTSKYDLYTAHRAYEAFYRN